ncbi:endonuclease [Aeromicrobium sp. CF4.19]|uniref:endonuclease n=1 Tax=Aeromicrobium sp. CF4.19 TaxID=3373082 RepID=UPI003EE7C25C
MSIEDLLEQHGTTFAEEAGITLRDEPSPLWRLLVLSLLLSARIDAGVATASARELGRAGWRTPRAMRGSTWQQRVDALGRGGYRRYDEKTATQLAEAADLVLDTWGGDLRRLRRDADGDVEAIGEGLQRVKGIGPAGAAIFLREVQGVWPEVAPYVDALAARGAEAAGVPRTGPGLARHVEAEELPRLVAACVRVALAG